MDTMLALSKNKWLTNLIKNILRYSGVVVVFSTLSLFTFKLNKMKKVVLLVVFFASVGLVKAQRGWGHHHQCPPSPYYSRPCAPRVVVCPPPRIGFGIGYRRPGINVVIAPRPVVVAPPPPVYNQPQVERIWIEGHYEDTPNGRIWVEGHYIQREVY